MSLILDGTNGLSDVDGTASTPAIRGTDTNTGIFFPAADTIAFSEGGTEAMRIDSAGNVGIGTSSPLSKLHANSSNTGLGQIVASCNTFNAGDVIGLDFKVSGNNLQAFTRALVENSSTAATALTFGTATGGNNATERMRIDSNGNLLVGTATGYGNRLVVSAASGAAAGRFIVQSSSASDVIYFMNPNGVVGSIVTNGSSTSYVTSSDYRLKENIAPMTGALDKIAQLNPVTYNWKAKFAGTNPNGQGFIAHELQAVVPDAVVGEKDAVDAEGKIIPQGIDTSFLVATLTAAIQELKTIVDQQSIELDSVKAELATLKGAV